MIAIIGDKLTMLGGKQDSSEHRQNSTNTQASQRKQSYQDAAYSSHKEHDLSDDIPF
jgi:single-stranded DNA-binding protein